MVCTQKLESVPEPAGSDLAGLVKLPIHENPRFKVACIGSGCWVKPRGPFEVRALTSDEWAVLRDVRLAALSESPGSFLSTHEQESGYDEARWKAEFSRGRWYVAVEGHQTVGVIGATHTENSTGFFIECLWVAPAHRFSGVGSGLLAETFDWLWNAEASPVQLWVLDGADYARRFYEKRGFASTGFRQELAGDRTEELMRLEGNEDEQP
jgi:GNAT superfamily N-acetyltransferase